MEEKIVCVSCGKDFVYTEGERLFLEGLLKEKKIPEIVTPKKCVPCRSAFRRAKASPPRRENLPVARPWKSATAVLPSVAPEPAPGPHDPGCMCHRCGDQSRRKKPAPDVVITPLPPLPDIFIFAPPSIPAPGTPTAEEIVVLVASDFEALVCREDVVWRQGNRKITIRLADIGPEALKKAMEAAVLRWWKS